MLFLYKICRIFVAKKMDRKEMWLANYNRLKAYVEMHRQFPDKKKVENRGLLNWWKYNMKCLRSGKLDGERRQMLMELSNMRLVHGIFADEKQQE